MQLYWIIPTSLRRILLPLFPFYNNSIIIINFTTFAPTQPTFPEGKRRRLHTTLVKFQTRSPFPREEADADGKQ